MAQGLRQWISITTLFMVHANKNNSLSKVGFWIKLIVCLSMEFYDLKMSINISFPTNLSKHTSL